MFAASTLAQAFPVFPLAALPSECPTTSTTAFLLAANSRLGCGEFVAMWQPGVLPSNPRKALGLPVCLYDSGRRSRSTGKERDSETGLDYFGARYYSGAQGRWTSPDVINLTDERILNPSNTLNKYIYGGNNPLKYTDPDGRDITVLYEQGAPTGHVMMAAVNQRTGDSAILSVGPATQQDPNAANPLNWFSGVPGTTTFNLPKTVDELRQNFAALTIQTSPEVAQQAIDAIRGGAGSGNWALLGNNCTSACAKVLHDIGLLPNGLYATPFPRPNTLWNALRYKYQPNLSASQRSNLFQNSGSLFKVNNGTDYGSPRFGMNTFDFIMLTLPKRENVTSKICFTDESGKQVCQ